MMEGELLTRHIPTLLENNGIITNDNYYEDREYITASMIKAASTCSKVKFDHIMNSNIETESMLIGSAFHHMMLEPDTFNDTYAFEPAMDRRTKAGKEYIQEWKELNSHIPNHVPGKSEEMLLNMKENLLSHPTYLQLMSNWDNSYKEEIFLFNMCNSKCKLKVDYYDPIENYIVDIKTCNSINRDDVIDAINKYQYFLQAAFYMDALQAKNFYFVFIEKKAPHDILIADYTSRLDDGRVFYSIGISNIELFRNIDKSGDTSNVFHNENIITQL